MAKKALNVGVVRGNPERTKGLILEAALDEFAENGYGGGRIDEIAKKAGVNKQALYYHFENKDGLYRATLEFGYQLVRSFDEAAEAGDRPPGERLAALIHGYFENVRAHQNVVALVAEENRLRGRHLGESHVVTDVNAPFVAKVVAIYRDGTTAGVFRSGVDPLQLWIDIVSVTQFYFSNAYTISHILQEDMKSAKMVARRKEHVVDFVLSGLRA